MTLGPDPQANIRILRKENPHWKKERITAAALDAARRNGNKNIKADVDDSRQLRGSREP